MDVYIYIYAYIYIYTYACVYRCVVCCSTTSAPQERFKSLRNVCKYINIHINNLTSIFKCE